MNVMDGEESGNAELLGFSRDQPGHPVVAVDDVRLHAGDDVVDQIPLEGQRRHEEIFLAGLVNPASSVEFTVFRKVNPVTHRDPGAFAGVGGLITALKEIPVMGNRKMDVFFGRTQAMNEQSRDIGETSGLGSQLLRIVRKFL